MTLRRFYAPEVKAPGDVLLSEEESRHLKDVLRLNAGDAVHVFDGAGNEFSAVVAEVRKKAARLTLEKRVEAPAKESSLDLDLAITLLKGEKLDLVIQKAVELGVNSITPINSTRCEVRSKDSQKRIERWKRIAIEAAKQCGRARVPSIHELTSFRSLCEEKRPASTTAILFSERDGTRFEALAPAGKILAVFGPEGGWEDDEIEFALANGFRAVTFGGRIMKADTAAIAVSAILQHRFGDIN